MMKKKHTSPSTLNIMVKDILSKCSLHDTFPKDYNVVDQEAKPFGTDSCVLVTRSLSITDMTVIIKQLTMADLICETASDKSNFCVVHENPTPTSESLIKRFDAKPEKEAISITRIPITLAEGMELAKLHCETDDSKVPKKDLRLIANGAGKNSFVVVCDANKKDSRKHLDELAQKLCAGGLHIELPGKCNFILVKAAPEILTTPRVSENVLEVLSEKMPIADEKVG